MKKLCTHIAIILTGLTMSMPQETYAQNLMNYTYSSNGERGAILFPENTNGDIEISNIVECDSTTTDSEIKDNIENYLNIYSQESGATIKIISNTQSAISFTMSIPYGKQVWGMNIWGSPLFAMAKDATIIKFKGSVQVKNNKFMYKLTDFETNRNTIPGEAKNDGQSNTIHWQRVNSLKKELYAYSSTHNSANRQTKEKVFDYNSQIMYETTLYVAEYNLVKALTNGFEEIPSYGEFNTYDFKKEFERLNMENKAMLPAGTYYNFTTSGYFSTPISQRPNVLTQSNKSNSSDPYAQGSKVYVTSGDNFYEMAGAKEICKQIIIDGYWYITDNRNEADLIIDYTVNLEGRDKAHVKLYGANGRTMLKEFVSGASEDAQENRETARGIYLKKISKLYKNKK